MHITEKQHGRKREITRDSCSKDPLGDDNQASLKASLQASLKASLKAAVVDCSNEQFENPIRHEFINCGTRSTVMIVVQIVFSDPAGERHEPSIVLGRNR